MSAQQSNRRRDQKQPRHNLRSFVGLEFLEQRLTLSALSITDVQVVEVDTGGTSTATFTVNLSPAAGSQVKVNFATANGTATLGDNDYVAKSGQLTFPAGITSRQVTVVVKGDSKTEQNETFFVNLSSPINATISDSQGKGTILNDDWPRISITDVSTVEGNGGTKTFVFGVNLNAPNTEQVTVAFATANGSATAGSDYVGKSGVLTFTPGATSRQIAVVVNGDTSNESNETFFVNLSSANNSLILDGQGVGTIVNDDPAPPPGPAPEIDVQGNGTSIPDNDTTPAVADNTDYGNVVVGGTVTRTFTIYNTGSAALNLGVPSRSGSGDFTITAFPTTPVAPGGSTTIDVAFAPSSLGAKVATLTIPNNDSNENPYNFNLKGTGIPLPAPEARVTGLGIAIPDGDASPTAADGTDYGNVAVGSPLVHTFVIHNDGNADLLLGTATLSGSPDFAITGTLPTPLVPAGGSTSIEVTFFPTIAGPQSAALSIPNNDADEAPYNFVLSGNGVGPDIRVTGLGSDIPDGDISSTAADGTDFGDVPVATAVVHTFVIHNDGLTPLNVVGTSLLGSGDFTLTGAGFTTPVPPGGSTSFDVTFTPSSTGPKSATLSIGSDDPDESPYEFILTGNGVGPDVRVTGNTFTIADGDTSSTGADGTDFGSVPVATPVTHEFVIHNDGPANLTLGPIVITGSSDFVIDPPFPPPTIVPGGSISVFVTFMPSSAGPKSATLEITSDDPDESPYTFTLDGIGF